MFSFISLNINFLISDSFLVNGIIEYIVDKSFFVK